MKYEEPKMEMIWFEEADIITLSAPTGDGGGDHGDNGNLPYGDFN